MGVAVVPVADLSNSQLLGAVRGVQKHAGHERTAGREWRPRDTATMVELAKRSWNWAVVEGLKSLSLPRCIENLCERVSATGRRMHRAAWRPLLAALCGAYRAGRMGVRLSIEQIAVMLGTSRRTALRVVREMREARILRRDHTYLCDEGGTVRVFDVSVYSLGGRALEYVRGGLEPGDRGKRWGSAARRRARNERRDRYLALWATQRETRGPTFAEQWLHPGAPTDVSLRGRDKVAPTPLKSGGHEQSGPPDCGEIEIEGGRSQRATPAPLQAARAPERHQDAGSTMPGPGAQEQETPTTWAAAARSLLFSVR